MKKIKIKQNEWAFPLYEHMGDSYILCSLMKAFKKKYGGKIVIITPTKYKDIPKMFKSIDKVIVHDKIIPHLIIIYLLRFIKVLPRPIKKIVIKIIDSKQGKISFLYKPKEDIAFTNDFFRNFADRLGLNKYTFEKPNRPKKSIYKNLVNKFKRLGLKPKRTVILYPVSYSAPLLPNKFWEELAEEIKKKGYTVATNVIGNEKEIKGTIPLYTSIEEKFASAEIAGTVIGIRSGIFDVISYANCKKIIIYTYALDPSQKKVDYSIKGLPHRGKIKEIFVNNNSTELILDKVLKILTK
jgi:ADP-heptose:LPS heptosyltransferase